MAKHFVKLEDGHWAWLTDEEYKKHKRGGCLIMIIAILIFFVENVKNEDKGSKDNNKSVSKTEQVSKKGKSQSKKDIIPADSTIGQDTHEENTTAENEQPQTFNFLSEPIRVDEEETEEIITIGESERNNSDSFID